MANARSAARRLPASYEFYEQGTDKGAEELAGLLFDAIEADNDAAATAAIDAGADLNAELLIESRAIEGTPLHAAVDRGNRRIVELLLRSGADVNAADLFGHTALHWVAEDGDIGLATCLLDRGADPNILAIADRSTPLYYAALGGHASLVELLISKGADVNPEQSWITPLEIAAGFGFMDVAELLIRHGAKLNMPERFRGNTPLHYAAWQGNAAMAELLIESGADVNADSEQGRPLDVAIQKRHTIVAAVLKVAGARKAVRVND